MLQNRKVKIVSFLLVSFTWSIGTSQEAWFRRLDVTGLQELSSDMVLAPDGGYLVAGTAEDNPLSSAQGTKDIVIVKLNVEGEIQWTQRLDYVAANVSWDEFRPNLIYEADGSILVVAGTHNNSNAGDGHIIIWRLSADGQIISQTFSEPQSLVHAIKSQSGEIVTAGLIYNCWFYDCNELISLNTFNAQLEHQMEISSFGMNDRYNWVFDLVDMQADGYAMLNESYYWYNDEAWRSWLTLEIFDPVTYHYQGIQLGYQEGGTYFDGGIIRLNDDEVVVGYYEQGVYKLLHINIRTHQVTFFNSFSDLVGFGTTMARTSDGGFIIVSEIDQSSLGLTKLSMDGNTEWERILPVLEPLHPDTPASNYVASGISAIHQTPDGGYVISGHYIADKAIDLHELYVLKVDANGIYGSLLEGYVKLDENSDCIADINESPLENWIVEAKGQQSFFTTTDVTGYYSMQLPLDDYDILFSNPNPGYWTICPQQNSIQVTTQGDTIRLDQAIQIAVQCPLMDISLASGRVNICNETTYAIRYCNYGSIATDTAAIKIELNEHMVVQSASVPFSQNGNVVEFDLGTVPAGDCGEILVRIFLACDAPADVFCVKASITPALYCLQGMPPPGILFTDVVCRNAGQPVDPNGKSALPEGEGPLHKILADSTIRYQIDFQNTGTDTAVQVILRDTLSAHFDISTFQPGASSHPCQYEIIDQGKLKVTFNNIHLPDSTTNPEGSKGFFTYQIKPAADIDFGVRLYNSASIYFDYQPPILTNTVLHTIAKPVREAWIETALCYGDLFEGMVMEQDTFFTDTLILEKYDSIRHIFIQVLPEFKTEVQASICEGEEYVFEGEVLTAAGMYMETYSAVNGCDSAVVLSLLVLDTSHVILAFDLCAGEISPVTQLPYEMPGIYHEHVSGTNVNGCDSNVIVALQVFPEEQLFIDKELPYGTFYHGVELTHDTVFVILDTTAHACLLTIFENVIITTTATIEAQEAGIRVFPNPMADKIQLSLDVRVRGDYAFDLIDLQGRWITNLTEIILSAGHHELQFPVAGLEPGMYVLLARSGAKTTQIKLVKL